MNQLNKHRAMRVTFSFWRFIAFLLDAAVAVILFSAEPHCITPWDWILKTIIALIIVCGIHMVLVVVLMQK